jgi:50S ribosomal protein L16 3-hydroxylase
MKKLERQNKFWSDFIAHYWEQSPLVTDIYDLPITTSDEIFSALLKYADRYRDGTVSDSELRWIFNCRALGHAQLGMRYDYREYMARSQDGSLAGYISRLASHDIYSYFLQLADYHIYNIEVWNRIREFTINLYNRVGMPGQKAWCDIVIGRYDCTPFGVHLDGASNFAFGIEGIKTIYLWEPEFYQREMAHRDPYDYRRYLSKAIALDITPGKMIYWPSQYWHVAESNGELSVVLNLAFYIKGSAVAPLLDNLSAELGARLGEKENAARYDFNASRLLEMAQEEPYPLSLAADTLKRTTEGNWAEHALSTIWLQKLTGLCYRRAILPKPYAPLNDEVRVRVDSRYPVLYRKLSDNILICSANGHCLKTTGHPNVIEMLRHLNSGRVVRVGDVVDGYADGFVYDTEGIRSLIETLVSWHAATIVDVEDHSSLVQADSVRAPEAP